MLRLAVTLLTISSAAWARHGSCRAARKCCDGKDTDCEVKLDPTDTNIILNFSGESCYCDHGCLDMGDCCPDYKDYCGVYDCEVSPWSDWAECATPEKGSCGMGTQRRERELRGDAAREQRRRVVPGPAPDQGLPRRLPRHRRHHA